MEDAFDNAFIPPNEINFGVNIQIQHIQHRIDAADGNWQRLNDNLFLERVRQMQKMNNLIAQTTPLVPINVKCNNVPDKQQLNAAERKMGPLYCNIIKKYLLGKFDVKKLGISVLKENYIKIPPNEKLNNFTKLATYDLIIKKNNSKKKISFLVYANRIYKEYYDCDGIGTYNRFIYVKTTMVDLV